jgi:hypothetical protein
MANTVSLLSYANTFGDWVVTTNFLTQQNNNLVANNYVKSTGTLYLNDPSLGLQVANGAIFAGAMQVQGLGSSASIQNTLSVGGLATFSNTTQSITTSGPVSAGGQLSATGSGVGLYVANNATVNGSLTVSQNTNVTGALTVFGPTSISGVTAVSNTFSTTGAVSFGSTGAFTGSVTAPSFIAGTSMATQFLSVSNPAGATVNGSSIITAATYNTYAPSLTGLGASGTWNININGNATNANTATVANTLYSTSDYTANTFTVASTGFVGNALQNGWALCWGNNLTGGTSGSRIYDNSSLHIYTDDTTYFDSNGSSNWYWRTSATPSNGGSPSTLGTLDGSGNFTAAGNVTAYSDLRLKSNVQTITGALDKTMQLRGVTFDKDGRKGLGVIAQEIREILPEVVMENNDENKTLSVAYGNIVGLLIESIKELKAEIDELKKK